MATTSVLFRAPNPKTKRISPATEPRSSNFTPPISLNPHPYPSRLRLRLRLRLGVAAAAVVEEAAGDSTAAGAAADAGVEEEEKRRKLYVVNLPWGFSAPEIEKLFGECGTVKDVEIIKQKNGKSRGFAFVTMASGEEAQAAVEKLNNHELMGRVVRVEFSKSFRKPPPPPPPGAIVERHKVYVSNLAWKARSTTLREFFSKFNPLSARVVFENPSGRSAGYGFVAFATKEEGETAIAELDGKDLMGRPVRLKWSQKVDNDNEGVKVDHDNEVVLELAHDTVLEGRRLNSNEDN